jgi:hypothetical protein
MLKNGFGNCSCIGSCYRKVVLSVVPLFWKLLNVLQKNMKVCFVSGLKIIDFEDQIKMKIMRLPPLHIFLYICKLESHSFVNQRLFFRSQRYDP